MKHKHEKMKKIALIIVAVLAAVIFAQIGRKVFKSTAKAEVKPFEVTLADTAVSVIEETVTLYGVAEGDPQVKVYPMVHGKFEKTAVTEGDKVNKGQALLYINRDITGMDFQFAPLKAPISGTVTRIYYSDKGAAMSPDRPAAEIADTDNIKVVLNTGEADIVKMKKGMRAVIKSAYTDYSIEGGIYSVTPFIDNDTMAGTVIIKAENKEMGIKPGMSVKVEIYTQSRQGIVLPKNALLSGAGRVYVYINENNAAKAVNVETGYESGRGVEIVSGLSAGQQVVVEGNFKLSEGSKIISTKQ